jgi:uncharacterized protein YjhX (UPF0386 family)
MLKKEKPLLLQQIKSLEELNKTYETQDSIRIMEINNWRNQSYQLEDINVKLSKKLKIYKKIPYISGGIIAVLLGLIIIR